MKKFLLATVALAALGAGAPALAADMAARPAYTKAPAYAAPIYNWTGFYIGGHIGGAFGGNNGFAGTTNTGNNGRFLGGLQGGADYQFSPNWVLGIEGQYSWLGNSNNSAAFNGAGAGFVFTSNQRAIGSVTGRLGYTWGPGMLYAKGGYAYSDYRDTLTFNGAPVGLTGNNHHDGYTVGAGVEYMFAPSWSAKVEYQYYDFGKLTFATPPLSAFGSTRNDEHTVKAGINYRFNWGGPVAARY